MVRGATRRECRCAAQPGCARGGRCYGPRPMGRVLFALLSCAFAAVALGACGSSDESVDSLLKQTFASNKSVHSGRLNAQLDANVAGIQGLNGPVRVRLSGPFQSAGKGKMPSFDFTVGLTAGGQAFTAGGVSTGDKGFVKFQGKPYVVSDQLFKQFRDGYLAAAKSSQKKNGSQPSLGALGIDPRSWLRGARKAGTQTVAGVDTFHITSGIDVTRLLDDINRLLARAGSASGAKQVQRLTDAQRKQIQDAVQSATVDVYTGKDDKLLRRLDVHVALKKSGRIKGGNLRFQLQLDALNKDQEIKAPTGAHPLSELTGAGAAGGTATTPTTPPPTVPSGGGNSDYLKCLDQAGDNVDQVQQCAQLLGK